MANIWTAAGDGDIQRSLSLDVLSARSWGHHALLEALLAREAAANLTDVARADVLLPLLQRSKFEVAADIFLKVAVSDPPQQLHDTPLHHLVHSELSLAEMRPVMELLLRHGADPRLRNNEGQTCLDAARDAARAEEAIENGEDEEGGLDVNETEFAKLLRSCESAAEASKSSS
ncbi:unnamed protein product [Polarella glacialis]|uniref:Uncharacterized protein n=1 Tax=Polarella glacialis TaxID=89957 RepID=A0A813HAW9_POLGL|nr:unnamed protein product [Polarella glacialis]